jgi:hypothetical protein
MAVFNICDAPADLNPSPAAKSPPSTFSCIGTIPREENSMNLAGAVEQLRKERDQAARTVAQLDAALAALDGGSPRQNAPVHN